MVSVDILQSDLWRNHVLTMYVRMLARGEAGPDHHVFQLPSIPSETTVLFWDVLDLYEMNI
jgi:hypothetical protein